MELSYPPPRRKKRASRRLFLLFGLLVSIGIVLSSVFWYFRYVLNMPNPNRVAPDFNGLVKPIFYRGTMHEQSAAGEGASLKLPLSFIRDVIDPAIIYEEETGSVIITTKDKVVRLKTDQLTAMVNEKPVDLRFPVEKQGDTVYVPVDPLKQFYPLDIIEAEQTGIVIVHRRSDAVQWGKAVAKDESGRTVAVRSGAGIKFPIVADVSPGDSLIIWSEQDGWYRVQLQNGYVGYANKSDVALDRIEVVNPAPEEPTFIPWKPLGGKINLTWEHVTSKNPDTSKIGPMPGLNVVSPTWFHLVDGEGNLKNLADPAYVRWAHGQNLQVWALFSNSFDPDLTTQALATYDRRMNMIKQLLAFAKLYRLQGINIDFENVYLKDKANLTQFVREMVPLMHEQGLVVSIDVTVKSTSENWSMFYDRRALAEVVDYMMVMTYDEHWASSPKAGSVASLPWVERSIVRIMEEDGVPASKLVLGVPYYTRIWTEQTKDGATTVTSKAVSMETVNGIIREKGLKPVFSSETGQHYVEYGDGPGKVSKIWIEDETSMKARIELVKKYDLAGVASWRRGFETPNIWDVIFETLEKRP